MSRSALRIAVAPLAIGVTMVGCSTTPSLFQPVAASSQEARADRRAAVLIEKAQEAARGGHFAAALSQAEQAVALVPRDAGYRMTLGDLYLKNGRFRSAETTFSDVLSLHPDNSRAGFSLALAQIALGKKGEALGQLEQLATRESPADLGLAFALAGRADRAVAMLEPAAREAGATARVRQNLALAYALSGDWAKAQAIASQDLSPADLAPRMEEWAGFAQPRAVHDQVAAMLGVTPVEDPGQPVQLALAPEAAAPVALAEVAVAAPAMSEPVTLAIAPAAQPQVTIAAAAPPAPVRVAAAKPQLATPAVPAAGGRYVVQLGSYNSAAMAQHAWRQVSARYRLGGHAPLHAAVRLPGGTFHRLSVAGFAGQAQALAACRSIRAKGGTCFVRARSGDAPIRFASRNARRG